MIEVFLTQDAMEERGSLTIKSYVEDGKVVLEITDRGVAYQ
ncbi:hypothetical protein SBF1_2390007 [Candidatus Desulfosporosinus infrequens]|uniref:Uncharacterized protein n=1 Tax=Candidatus Desulfosporosinus infrequens TaxID=2043169 RepID=A0A2U3KN36_9FIRM|nr:hypothetical protein SBF1_2390007 [Candidatus Desulfosporosinus infrequens]